MKISALNFNMFSFVPAKVDNAKSNQNKNLDLKDLYPQKYNNYLSFGRKELKKEDFPNEKIYKIYSEKVEFDKSTKLLDVHNSYYANLLRCSDIYDVRVRYPEFQNVKFSSYLKDYKQKNFIRRLCENSNNELTLSNFSLKLLQDYYANNVSITDFARKYGTKYSKIKEIMEALNIPVMNDDYTHQLYNAKKDSKDTVLIKSLPAWQQRTIAKNQGEINAPNKIKREQMLNTIHKTSMYEKKLADASFVSVLMPLLFENYNNPQYRQDGFSMITDKLADKWQDERYVNFVRQEPIEQWENDLTDSLLKVMNDEDKKKMKVYVNSAILAWKKQPSLNTKIYKEINLRPSMQKVIQKVMMGEDVSSEDEKVIKDFYMYCEKIMPRFSQIMFENQKEILNDWVQRVG